MPVGGFAKIGLEPAAYKKSIKCLSSKHRPMNQVILDEWIDLRPGFRAAE